MPCTRIRDRYVTKGRGKNAAANRNKMLRVHTRINRNTVVDRFFFLLPTMGEPLNTDQCSLGKSTNGRRNGSGRGFQHELEQPEPGHSVRRHYGLLEYFLSGDFPAGIYLLVRFFSHIFRLNSFKTSFGKLPLYSSRVTDIFYSTSHVVNEVLY